MSISKRVLLAAGACFVVGLSSAAIAQTKGNAKSAEAATIEEGDAMMLHPKGTVHKSHVKVTAAQHEAAMRKGAHEVRPGSVIYRQAGKLYMLQNGAPDFQDNFDIDY